MEYFIIKDIIIAILIIALSVGYLFEDRIAKWERRTARKVINKLRKDK